MNFIDDDEFVRDLAKFTNIILKSVSTHANDWSLETIIYGLVVAAGRIVVKNQGVVDEEKLMDVLREALIDQDLAIKKDYKNFN